jgi:hypothetical protein
VGRAAGGVHAMIQRDEHDRDGDGLEGWAKEREEEVTDELETLEAETEIAADYEAGPFARRAVEGIDPVQADAVERREIDDAAFLAEAFRRRPHDRVSLFDLAGDPMGYGLRDGATTDGRVRVLVPGSAVEVAGSARTADGDAIERPAFVAIGAGDD